MHPRTHPASPASQTNRTDQRSNGISRRAFVTGASAGAAAIGLAAAVPALTSDRDSDLFPASSARGAGASSGEPFVALVHPNTGEVMVMRGTEEFSYKDPDLVRRLLDHAR